MGLLIRKNKGFSLIEVLVSISLLMLVLVGSLSANSLATNAVKINKTRSYANMLAKEAMEALQGVRAASFDTLISGDFHPVKNLDLWVLASGSETIGQYTRTITLSPVMRNLVCSTPLCEIASGGGLIDPLSFWAKVKVTWKENDDDKTYQFDSLVTYWR